MADRPPVYELAIVKGLVEHHDATVYFGSLLGFGEWSARAAARGWITLDPLALTEAGREVYRAAALDRLPTSGRAAGWDWSRTSLGSAWLLDRRRF